MKIVTQGTNEYHIPTDFKSDSGEIFSITNIIHNTRHLTNEPFSITFTYNYRYVKDKQQIETVWQDKQGEWQVSGICTNVSPSSWERHVADPFEFLIPWSEGAYLD